MQVKTSKAAILVTLYVLSIGPAVRFCGGVGGWPALVLYPYLPVVAMYQYYKPFQNFMDWYLERIWNTRYWPP